MQQQIKWRARAQHTASSTDLAWVCGGSSGWLTQRLPLIQAMADVKGTHAVPATQ